ncbi:hypothetical protein FQZ97_780440 [compost metagenome]
MVPALAQPLDGAGNGIFPARQGDHPRRLHEGRRAGAAVLDQLADVAQHRRRHDDPAQAPSGHAPGLGEGIAADDPVLGRRDVQEGRRARRIEADALVDIVADDPDAQAPAVREDGFLRLARKRPARRVVGRVQQQRAGARPKRFQKALLVEHPTGRGELQCDGLDVRAQHLGHLHQVGPQRRHGHDAVAGVQQRLQGQHQRMRARTRHRHPFDADRAMPARQVPGDLLAQRGLAQRLDVEGAPVLECGDRSAADLVRRLLVGLAEPERQDVLAVHARIGDLADLRGPQGLDFGACDGRWRAVGGGALHVVLVSVFYGLHAPTPHGAGQGPIPCAEADQSRRTGRRRCAAERRYSAERPEPMG